MKVAVIIPIYRKDLSALELRSLEQANNLLYSYPIVVIKPRSLDLSEIAERYPLLTFESFEDAYFQNIPGYNALMLSTLFYERFLEYQYILIYQLDAYVFKDELLTWCDKGFDYIGAPWLKKRIYQYPVISSVMRFLYKRRVISGKPSKQSLYNKVGNGGFSLRKVESHYQATMHYKEKIKEYLSHEQMHFYNEDVFWACEVSEFQYPSWKEALHFSFDKYPSYSFKLTGNKLPFGCHGWYKRKMKGFWKPIIGF